MRKTTTDHAAVEAREYWTRLYADAERDEDEDYPPQDSQLGQSFYWTEAGR